jgi:hypothetical protein
MLLSFGLFGISRVAHIMLLSFGLFGISRVLYAAVLRIIWYIKGTLFYGLHYSATSPLILRACSDTMLKKLGSHPKS